VGLRKALETVGVGLLARRSCLKGAGRGVLRLLAGRPIMKEVKAYVRCMLADEVIRQLKAIGIQDLTAIDVSEIGSKVSADNFRLSSEYGTPYTPVTKIELICGEEDVPKVVDTIRRYGYTGKKGDGIIAVSDVEEVVSIRTGKRGREAI